MEKEEKEEEEKERGFWARREESDEEDDEEGQTGFWATRGEEEGEGEGWEEGEWEGEIEIKEEDMFSLQQQTENYFKQTRSLFRQKRKLRREENNIFYRLTSIIEDSLVVSKVSSHLCPHFPLYANLRCGLWYSDHFDGNCYFKSTDGHVGYWSFSLARLNLNVVTVASEKGGCVLVDSTRKGKEFPDSFTRTIPIWCCVINRAIAQIRRERKEKEREGEGGSEGEGWDEELHMPVWAAKEEKAMVEERIPGFVEKLLNSGANLQEIEKNMNKPLRPFWVSPLSRVFLDLPSPSSSSSSTQTLPQGEEEGVKEGGRWLEGAPFTPIICLSVSKPSGESHATAYVQGAGDDEEAWSLGLTPFLFWNNQEKIMSSGPSSAPEVVRKIVEEAERERKGGRGEEGASVESGSSSSPSPSSSSSSPLSLTRKEFQIGGSGLFISISSPSSSSSTSPPPSPLTVLDLSEFPICFSSSSSSSTLQYYSLPVQKSNQDKRKLDKLFPKILEILSPCFEQPQQPLRLLLHSDDGSDTPVCVCVGILLSFYDIIDQTTTITSTPQQQGKVVVVRREKRRERKEMTKEMVRRFLMVVQDFFPDGRPPQVMMKMVTRYFLSPSIYQH